MDTITNRNVARIAGEASAALAIEAMAVVSDAKAAAAEAPSSRIRQAQDVLRQLLLDDDDGNTALSGSIAVRLDRLQLELNQLAGLQTLFELWSEQAP